MATATLEQEEIQTTEEPITNEAAPATEPAAAKAVTEINAVTPEQLAKLFELQRESDECEQSYIIAKEQAKQTKEHLDSALLKLKSHVRSMNKAEGDKKDYPLFDKADIQNDRTFGAVPEPEKNWRAVPVAELELPQNIIEKLLAAGPMETLGDLEDLRGAIAGHKKDWPKGVGNAKQTQIEDAVIRWWQDHPEYIADPIDDDAEKSTEDQPSAA